jgi:hypothetical protein
MAALRKIPIIAAHNCSMKLGWLLIFVAVAGCSNAPSERQDTPTAKRDRSTDGFTVTDPTETPSAWLSDGRVGFRINRRGDGEGEPFFSATGYQKSGEEKLVAQPTVCPPLFKIDGAIPNVSELKNYRQTLDPQTGVLATEYTWNAHQVRTRIAIDPETGVITQESNVSPTAGVSTFDGYAFSNPTSATTTATPPTPPPTADKPTFSTSVGNVVDGDSIRTYRHVQTRRSSISLTEKQLDMVATKYQRRPQIEIEGDEVSQSYARSLDFYLRQSVNADGTMSVAPMGLSSDHYFGHVFWDADVWVLPALALLDPARAKAIPNYRLRLRKAAEENFQRWLGDGRPTGHGSLGSVDSTVSARGAKYPWESAVSGKETVPGPSKFEDHLTGSVAWSLRYGAKLGLVDPVQSAEITRLAGLFYVRRMSPTGLLGTMSPDENHIGDNDLYTNILANECIDTLEASKPNPRAPLPKDEKSFLTYDNDPVRGYKQAAAVLAIYPLQYAPAEKQASVMLERFMDKVTKNGPAMSDSVHATILARLGRADEAYALWQKDRDEFANHPLWMFSEKRSKPVTYFVTGAGGWMQTLLYGFLGLRLDDQPMPGAAWKLKLKSGAWISGTPHLPSAWKRLAVTVVLDGKPYRLTASGNTLRAESGVPPAP